MNQQMGWRLDKYTDKLTGELVAAEIVPEGDLQPHVSSPDCLCIPVESVLENGALKLVHNAFDGRECLEPNRRERGN